MATPVNTDLFWADLIAIQRQLGRRAAGFMRTGKVLAPHELTQLYKHRHQIRPTKAEAKLILASMLIMEEPTAADSTTKQGLRTRRSALGWFWFRRFTARQHSDLLADLSKCRHTAVNAPASELLKIISIKKASDALLKSVHADPAASKEDIAAIKAIYDLQRPAPFQPVKSLPKLRQIAQNTALADWLRTRIVIEIGRFQQQEDLPLLRNLTADASPCIRKAAVEALVGYHHPDDVVLVRKLTRDQDQYVRFGAIGVIGRYGQPEDRSWLRHISLNRRHPHRVVAVNSLAAFKDPKDLPLYRKLACDSDHCVRQAAIAALGKHQDPVDVALLKKLAIRFGGTAIETLLTYPAKMITGAVRDLAREKDSHLRFNLAQCLGDWHHPEAAKILRRLTHAVEFDVRAAAAAALGAQGQAQDLPRLRHMCHWDTETVRREAVWAVAKYGKRVDIAFLKERLQDEAPAVRTVAAMALTRLLKHAELKRVLKQDPWLRFEPLVEFDFALYAPSWLRKAKPRIGDNDIGSELQMMRGSCPKW